jgi:hypothetical protein
MLALTDYSGDLVEKHRRVVHMSDFGSFLIWILFKNSVFIYISAFFLSVFLSGLEKKLYLYRIWLDKFENIY